MKVPVFLCNSLDSKFYENCDKQITHLEDPFRGNHKKLREECAVSNVNPWTCAILLLTQDSNKRGGRKTTPGCSKI